MSEGPAEARREGGSRLARLLGHPRLPGTAFGALALGFIALVAVYMDVAAREVPYAVRVESAPRRADDPTVFRLTVFRPSSGRTALALAYPRPPAGAEVSPPQSEIRSEWPTAFEVHGWPPEQELTVRLAFEDVPERELRVPPVTARGDGWLAGRALAGLRSQRRDAATGGVSRLRVDPDPPGLDLVLVADGGVPARFVENLFFVRVATPEGAPVADADVSVETPRAVHALRTDALGLAQLSETPLDLEVWTARAFAGEAHTEVRLEVAPSFDGLAFRPTFRLLGPHQAVQGQLSAQRDDPVFLDLYSDGSWLASRRVQPGSVHEAPRGETWLTLDSAPRAALVQLYSQPFSVAPQSAVRGLLFYGEGSSEAEAARALVAAASRSDLDARYLDALLADDALLAGLGEGGLERLVGYVFARVRPAFRPPAQVSDDADSQREALRAEIDAFRGRAHWLLALGSFALVAWMLARVARQMHEVRRRTQEVVAEVDDPELALLQGFGANAGAGGLLLVALATATVAGFCAGVIVLLTTL